VFHLHPFAATVNSQYERDGVFKKPPSEHFASVVGINMISKPDGLPGVKATRGSAEIDAEFFNRAEKELAAFVAAVNTLHGGEQTRAAADDWLLELTALEEPAKGASLDLRSVTIGAARRLARRLSMPSPAYAVLAVIAGLLLLIAPATALAVHVSSRHLVTQDKPANLVVIRWKAVSAKHEFQQDSDHESKNSHNTVCHVRFTHSCNQRVGLVGQN
jgi:hypothetical protein